MSVEPGISTRAVQPLVRGLGALGHDSKALLTAAGVEWAHLSDPEARIAHSVALRVWEEAVSRTGDVDIGLHVAESAPLEAFDVHGYAVLSSVTLRSAYQAACRYQRLIHETTQLELRAEADATRLCHFLPGGRAVPRQPAEFLLAVYVRLGRAAARCDWLPRQARFAHARPANIREHERLLGATPRFRGGDNSLLIANEVLDAPNPGADAGLQAVLDRYAADLLAKVPAATALSDRVRVCLARALGHGQPSLATTARALGMSSRSLSRALQEEGTTFRDLLDRLRHERANTLLLEGKTSIAEVAFLLGFSEVSAFYRAFKRWTGSTPVDYRRA